MMERKRGKRMIEIKKREKRERQVTGSFKEKFFKEAVNECSSLNEPFFIAIGQSLAV